jgi:hypothetical protein
MKPLNIDGAIPCPGCGELICGRAELSPETVDAIARRVAELLTAKPADATPDAQRLVDAAELARRLRVTPAWVREHADELGVVRIGEGPRPRLRFAVDRAMQAYNKRSDPDRTIPPATTSRSGVGSSRRQRRASPMSGAQTLAVPAWEE